MNDKTNGLNPKEVFIDELAHLTDEDWENISEILKPKVDFGFERIDPNCDGLIYARFGGYSELSGLTSGAALMYLNDNNPWPETPAGRLEMMMLFDELATSRKGLIDRIRDGIRSPLCWLVIMVVAYLVARFMAK